MLKTAFCDQTRSRTLH